MSKLKDSREKTAVEQSEVKTKHRRTHWHNFCYTWGMAFQKLHCFLGCTFKNW